VFDALGRWDDPRVANLILERYSKMDARLQPLAVELLEPIRITPGSL
jgi:hypothetical protein